MVKAWLENRVGLRWDTFSSSGSTARIERPLEEAWLVIFPAKDGFCFEVTIKGHSLLLWRDR